MTNLAKQNVGHMHSNNGINFCDAPNPDQKNSYSITNIFLMYFLYLSDQYLTRVWFNAVN